MPYAPGLPSKTNFPSIRSVSNPESWEFVVQEHHADKAGKHYDLRLGDPASGHGYSWALRYWPEAGEKRLAVQQPVHTIKYFDFQGEITDGYGKGRVTTFKRGKADIVESNDRIVKFLVPNGKLMDEFVAVRTSDKNWLLMHKKPFDPGNIEKPKFKKKEREVLDLRDNTKVLSAKIDGASAHIHFKKNQIPRAFSFRTSKRTNTPIEYTGKVKDLLGVKTPAELDNTVVRGEVFMPTKKGPAPVRWISGALNAGLDNSRGIQKRYGDLKVALYDIHKYKGKIVENLPYYEKYEILKNIKSMLPAFELPSIAKTYKEKKRLVSDILEKRHPQTIEGVVEWNGGPTKVPFHNQDDVWVVGVASAKPGTKYQDTHGGALLYSYTKNGTAVGAVGTGFTDSERKDMTDNPRNWVGKKIVVQHKGKMPSGALRAPAFKGFHLS